METVVIEITLWEAGKIQALLSKIESDPRVASVAVMSA